ncbi:MAG: CRISPR-associated endonuclease Cas1 [Desulfobacterales bacterium]
MNSLLSFGYTLLGNELAALLEARGLDPYLGFYHGIQYGRPSLAMDLLEPFRPAVDLFTMKLANLKILQPDHFTQRKGGYYLKDRGLKTYFKYFERWMNSVDRSGRTLRDWLRQQVNALARAIQNNTDFTPYRMS